MYDTIIFDLDGVITSESVFWNTAALTAAEFLCLPMEDSGVLRRKLFDEDRVIRLLKNRGVNSNWDLVYLAVAFWETNGDALFKALEREAGMAAELYARAANLLSQKPAFSGEDTVRGGALWQSMADSFQEWFLGSETFLKVYGKAPHGERRGLWETEEPIVGRENLLQTLSRLVKDGISLRIGTARPLPEGRVPLERWGAYPYFEKTGVITYDYIRTAEEALGQKGLGKPHPYIFLKAYFGCDFPDKEILSGAYEKDFSRCLVVGDAGADLFAAQKMGADFAAVLTGAAGEAAAPFFEENGATYILPDITHVPRILHERRKK